MLPGVTASSQKLSARNASPCLPPVLLAKLMHEVEDIDLPLYRQAVKRLKHEGTQPRGWTRYPRRYNWRVLQERARRCRLCGRGRLRDRQRVRYWPDPSLCIMRIGVGMSLIVFAAVLSLLWEIHIRMLSDRKHKDEYFRRLHVLTSMSPAEGADDPPRW
jgi:hypothetical protein